MAQLRELLAPTMQDRLRRQVCQILTQGCFPKVRCSMSDARARLEHAVAEFQAWAASYPEAERSAEWEIDYDYWPDLRSAAVAFLDSSEPQQWDRSIVELLLYVLARDNETEDLKHELTERPEHLLALAGAGTGSAEWDARWQLAAALGCIEADEDEVVPLLETYAADVDEYVSRRALIALGQRRAPIAERLARRAWDTGHEYQRMAALGVFHSLGSPLLPSYLELAEQDGRQHLIGFTKELR